LTDKTYGFLADKKLCYMSAIRCNLGSVLWLRCSSAADQVQLTDTDLIRRATRDEHKAINRAPQYLGDQVISRVKQHVSVTHRPTEWTHTQSIRLTFCGVPKIWCHGGHA